MAKPLGFAIAAATELRPPSSVFHLPSSIVLSSEVWRCRCSTTSPNTGKPGDSSPPVIPMFSRCSPLDVSHIKPRERKYYHCAFVLQHALRAGTTLTPSLRDFIERERVRWETNNNQPAIQKNPTPTPPEPRPSPFHLGPPTL